MKVPPKYNQTNFFPLVSLLNRKKPIKANSHGCSEIQKEIYKYFRVTMECFFFHFGLLQKPWSAKRNSEWFFSWSLAWNGNGFVRKLQLKKNLMGCVWPTINSAPQPCQLRICTAHTLAQYYLSVFSMANATTSNFQLQSALSNSENTNVQNDDLLRGVLIWFKVKYMADGIKTHAIYNIVKEHY